MTAHVITTGVLYLLAIVGVGVWIQRMQRMQRMLDVQAAPTDAQRFDEVARRLSPRKPAVPVVTQKQR